MKDVFRVRRMWRPRAELKNRYDVVIIGGGSHGLATAYYLAKNHGVRDVAVLEQSYIGSGASGRNTTIIRSNYLTPEGAAFYGRSVQLYEQLSADLDFNLMFSQHGHLTLAHSDRAMNTMQERAEVNQLLGIDSRVVLPDEIARLCPQLDLSDEPTWPIMGALYHAPGGIIRHDAVVWGLARGADRGGVEIHPYTAVTGINQENGRATGVETNRGRIACGKVLQAVAGSSSRVSVLAGFKLPIRTIPLQACVSVPLKPFLDQIVVSGSLHVYVSQSSRGELVMGGSTDPYGLYSTRSTLDFKEGLLGHMLELFPFLGDVKILRQWAGMADMTPDFSPVMGLTPVENYYIDSGWGTWGFKATPVCGKRMAETVATGQPPDILEPFRLDRFRDFSQVGEKGAASVGH
jgi:sarcosine oxidase subunit beta